MGTLNNEPERWQTLCEQASRESNPEKLLALVTEINRLLEARHGAAQAVAPPDTLAVPKDCHSSDGQHVDGQAIDGQSTGPQHRGAQFQSDQKKDGTAA